MDIAVEASGDLVVTDFGLGAVVRVDPVTGDRWIVSDGGTGAGPAFAILDRIAVEATGDLVVTDSESNAVLRVDPITGDRTIAGCVEPCGNGHLDPGEECDGGTACTDCVCDAGFEPTSPPSLDCQPICGNGVADPGEDCDGSAGTCPGGAACRSDCTCPPPPPTGACCADDSGVCTNDVTQAACEGSGRRYGGNGSTCATIDPPCQPAGAILAVSTWGLLVLALTLLVGMTITFSRRHSVRA